MDAQPIHVLLVEDNPGDARLVREMLRNVSDVVIHHVDRLAVGLAYISTKQVDVILLDLGLPDSDGLETLRVFVGSPGASPVVVFTGLDDEAMGEQAVSEGAQDYLIKNRVTGAILNRVLHYAFERSRVAKKLQQSEMLYRSLTENSPDLIAQFDRQCRHLYVNPSGAGAGHYRPEEYVGKSLAEVGVPEEEAEKWEKHIRAAFDTGRIIDVEDSFETSSGLKYFNTKLVPEAALDGSIQSVQSIARDITFRKRAEEQERLAAKVLELLNRSESTETTIQSILKLIKASTGFEAVGIRLREGDDFPYIETNGFPDHFIQKELYLCERDAAGVIILDTQGKPILECMCGNVLCGRTDAKQPFFTEAGSFWTNGTSELLAASSESEHQSRTRNRCNGEGYESVALIPLRSGAEVIGLLQLNDRRHNQFELPLIQFFEGLGASVGIAIERKRMDAEREKLQTQLMQAQKMDSIGRLAGGVAHDHNNMLSVILGYTELSMRDVNPSDPVHSNLEEIHKAAIRSMEITQQLLAFARKQTVAPSMIDLNGTVEGMLKMIRQLIGEDIEFTWNPGTGVWPVKLDPNQFDQILVNLCLNARDAISSMGRISIETGNITFDEAHRCNQAENLLGDYAVLTVSDNGEGMEKETLAMIFEPYFTTKEMGKGTGLGLSTVYGIVKQNDGMITVYSEPEMGTTFRIYLPRHTLKTEKIPREISAGSTMRGQETILLVEDEPAILKLTSTMLERQGYSVLSALTSSEAIRLASEHSGEIHLLMTDVVMPEMCGLELSKKLTSTRPGIRLLFCSGYTADIIAHQGVLDEGMHFIQKPFSIKNLAAKVREALEGA